MSEFLKLLSILERETSQQEKLLKLLSVERAAIVKLNQQDIEAINLSKERLLEESRLLESKRKGVIDAIIGVQDKRKEPVKFADILSKCTSIELVGKLKTSGEELKKLAISVQEMNNHNAELIKQSLGVISSTISLMKSLPSADLPTYAQTGVIVEKDSKNSTTTSRRVTRSA
jgi:flagellar biosynthesis/type III secretory pathway chaperone